MDKKGKLTKDMLFTCGIVAFIGAVGIIFFALGFCGVRIENCDKTVLVTIVSLLTGGFWGLMVSKIS